MGDDTVSAYVHILEARINELSKLEDVVADLQTTIDIIQSDCGESLRSGVKPCDICKRPTYWECSYGCVVNMLVCVHPKCNRTMVYCHDCAEDIYGTTYIGSLILCHNHLTYTRHDD